MQALASCGNFYVNRKVALHLTQPLAGHSSSPLHLDKAGEAPEEQLYQTRLVSVLAYASASPQSWDFYDETISDNAIVDNTHQQYTGTEEHDIYKAYSTSLQMAIPLHVILDRCLDYAKRPEFQAPFLRLLTSLYLSEAVLHREVRGNPRLQNLIESCMRQLPGMEDQQLARFGILPTLHMYWSNVHPKQGGHNSAFMKELNRGLGDQVLKQLQDWRLFKNGELPTKLYEALHKLIQKGPYSAPWQWQIADAPPSAEAAAEAAAAAAAAATKPAAEVFKAREDFKTLRDLLVKSDAMLFASPEAKRSLDKERELLGLSTFNGKVALLDYLVHEFQMLEDGHKSDGGPGGRPPRKIGINEPMEIVDDLGNRHTDVVTSYPSYTKIIRKMISHVNTFLVTEVHSGFDTSSININIMQLLTAILRARKPEAGDGLNPEEQEEQEKLYQSKQTELAQYGAMALVLNVLKYTKTEDAPTIEAACALGCQLLDNGNPMVQEIIKGYFNDPKASGHIFFQRIVAHLQDIPAIILTNSNFIASYRGREPGQSAVDNPDAWAGERLKLILDFLQLWSEGHNAEMQQMMLGQDRNRKSFNIVREVVGNLSALTADSDALRIATDEGLDLLSGICEFLTEIVQGPCEENQKFLVEASIVTYLKRTIGLVHNRYGRQALVAWNDTGKRKLRMSDLLKKACEALSAMIEGRSGDPIPVVQNRMIDSGMNVGLFKTHVIKLISWRAELEKKASLTKDEESIIANLNEAAHEMYSTYMHLASINSDLKKGLQPIMGSREKLERAYTSALRT